MSFSIFLRSHSKRMIAAGLTLLFSIAGQVHSQAAKPTSGKFVFPFQSGQDPTYQAFVVPLDFQTGVPMLPTSYIPWKGSKYLQFDSSLMLSVNTTVTPNTFNYSERVSSPLAYFGSSVGASSMYEEMSYRFALHLGDTVAGAAGSQLTSMIQTGLFLTVYAKSDMDAGRVDAGGHLKSVQTIFLPLPNSSSWAGVPAVSVLTASTQMGSQTVTVTSTSNLRLGQSVSGTGIPAGATIVNIDSSTQLTISDPATDTGTPGLNFGIPNSAWTTFGDNGYQANVSVNVQSGDHSVNILDTMVQAVKSSGVNSQWGDRNTSPLMVTHKAHAGAEQYYFVIGYRGVTQVGDYFACMSTVTPSDSTFYIENSGQPATTMGYALNFDPQSPWASKLLTTPNFQGTPMPPAYYGKSAPEIESQASPVELLNFPAPGSTQFNTFTTPELQPHTVLDQFVAQMGRNPLALAAYVQNHIALTDALAYNNVGNLNEASVNAGGMERAAIGTFLEGQGSPEEQCALLVYLLRKAGYQAAYVLPPRHSLQLADQRLSNLLRMRIAGALAPDGTPHSVPQFIDCNYPFVAAYVPTSGTSGTSEWVPLFPWLKDTDVEQGLNVNNYLPNGATNIRQWVRNFLLARSDSSMWDSDTSPLTSATLSSGTTKDSPVVTVPSTSGLIVGQTVKGPGIPAGALVASVGDATGTRTLTCSTSLGTNIVTVLVGTGTVGLTVGQTVTGAGIPVGATIYTINSPTTLALTAAATATSAGVGLTFANPPPANINLYCYTTLGSPTVTTYFSYTTSGLSVGMSVSGLGIPSGATIATINSSGSLTLSANATATTPFFPTGLAFIGVSVNKPTVVLTKNAEVTASAAALTFQSWDRTPGGFFIKSLADNLQKHFPGISLTDLGVNFLDRKYNYTSWGLFPQPIPVRPKITRQAVTTSGTRVLTVTDATGLTDGLAVSGPGIAPGTTLADVDGTTLTLSSDATATSSGALLSFGTNYTPSETLTSDGKLYDTMDITIQSDQNPSKTMTLTGLRIMDLHNRRAVINFIPAGLPDAGKENNYTMTFNLAPYDLASTADNSSVTSGTNAAPGTSFTYTTSGDTFMRRAQQQTMAVTSADQSYSLSVVYHRNRVYPGMTTAATAALGGWDNFLGIFMQDFSPVSIPLSSITTNGSKTVTISGGGANGLSLGMSVSGVGIPVGTVIASIVSDTSITLSNAATVPGTPMLNYGGVSGSTPPVVSHFSLGDLNAFCLNTGHVTAGMLNVHMQYYNQLQQQLAGSASNVPPATLDAMQGSLAYLMGMTYYQRMSNSMDSLKNLFQVNAVSTRAHGFAQFGAQKYKDASGTVINDGPNNTGNPLPLVAAPANTTGIYRMQQIFPKVDMRYAIDVHVAYDDLRADAGGQGILASTDFYTNLMIAQMSSLESQTIAQYFGGQNTDAVSTFSLLQKVQMGLNGSANPDIIELNLSNYATLGTTNYTVNGVGKTLATWAGGTAAGSTWSSVVAAFSGWDADQVRVYLTPGDSIGANGQWKGMVALIMGRDEAAALIGSLNALNGGVGYSQAAINSVVASITTATGAMVGNPNFTNISLQFGAGPGVAMNGAEDDQYLIAFSPTTSASSLTSSNSWTNSQTINFGNSSIYSSVVTTNPSGSLAAALAGNTGTLTAGTLTTLNSLGQGNLSVALINGNSVPGLAQLTSAKASPLGTIVMGAAGNRLDVGDPVNTLTGELYADETDLVLPGPLPLQIRRNYSSRSLGSGEFGYGWKAGMFPYLVPYAAASGTTVKIQAAEMDGTVITYSPRAGSSTVWVVAAADNPLLSNGNGMSIGSVRNLYYNTITLSGTAGSNGATYTLKGADGSVRVYTVKSYQIGSVSRQRPYLTSWADSVGNNLTFYFYGDGTGEWYSVASSDPAYGQLACVKSSNGNFVTFSYDAYGHIINIATGDGRQLTYTYDANGDLRGVEFPDGSWTQYDYLIQIGKVGTSTATAPYSTHLISQETRPGGRRVQTYYVKFKSEDLDETGAKVGDVAPGRIDNDVSTARRVDYQLASVGKGVLKIDDPLKYDNAKPVTDGFTMVKNAKYAYHFTADTSGNVTGRTEITDAYGRTTIYYFVNSRLVQIMDPQSAITDVTTGAGSNPKLVQTWYTAADVGTVTGAWVGGLRSIYQRGGTLTTYQYSAKVEHSPAAVGDTPGGDVVRTDVSGCLEGSQGPTSMVGVGRSSNTVMPALSGFVSPDTATTTATYYSDTHLPKTITRPAPGANGSHAAGSAWGPHTVFTYDTANSRPYHVSLVEDYDTPDKVNVLSTVSTTYQNKSLSYGLPKVVTANGATTTWSYNDNGFPTQKVSASGESQTTNPDSVVQFSYDLRGQLYQEQVMDGGSAAKTNIYAYDEMGRPIWVERRDGNGKQVGWNYTYYNLNGDVEWTQGSRLGPADYTYTSYDGAGRPVEKTTWRSRVKADRSGVEAIPGAEGYATTIYSYNMFGDLLGVTDPVGNSIQASYDSLGRKTGTIAYQGNWQTGTPPQLASTSTTYHDESLSVTTTDARGASTTLYSTSDGKPRKRVNPDGTELNYLYYLDGRIKRQQLTSTIYVDFAYNDVDRIVTKKTHNGTDTLTETVKADARGNITSAEDVTGFITSTTYDALNRPMTVTVPAAGSTSAARTLSHTYDTAGFMHKITDAAGEVSETDCDALGRPVLTQVAKITGTTTTVVSQSSVSYSSDFQSVTTTSGTGAGAISETVWTDLSGHTVLVKHADGSFASVAYDAAGNAIASSSETGQTTSCTYDGLQRLLTSTLPDGATTQFVYAYPSGGGQTVQRQMPGGLTEFTSADALGRPVESYLQGANNAQTRHYQNYTYFPDGKEQGLLKEFTDPNGYTHSITYNDWLRPETTTAGTGTAAVSRHFDYDPRGMATQIRETTSTGVSQIDRSYDAQGHLYDEKVSLGSSSTTLVAVTDLASTYDNVGRRASLARGSAISSVGASGGSWAFNYRADGMLSEVDVAGGAFTYTYGNNGLLQSRSNPFRNFSVGNRDSRGRIVNTATALVNGGATVVTENIASWTADNKQGGIEDQVSYSCWHQSSDLPGTPAAWTDSRSYTYSTQRRQLATESWTNSPDKTALNASISATQKLNYTFDGGAAGGLGVRTRAQTTTAGTTQQHLISAQDAWARATGETGGFEKRFPFTAQGTALGAASVDLRIGPKVSLDQVSFPAATATTTGAWSRGLFLPAGSYALNAIATHPSGQFNTQTSSSFTLAVQNFGVADTYDDVGNVKTRTVTDGTYTRAQTLAWDAEGRLMSVTQTDNSPVSQAFVWRATYDARSRRVQAQTQFTGSGPQAGRTLTETSWHDPLVEFLEVGLEVAWSPTGGSITSHERWWKVHGPDLSGGYGGLQGMGGLEAMVNEVNGEAVGFIDDSYGHILGFAAAPGVTSGSAPANAFVGITATFEWNVGRFGGYGPLPGYWSPAVGDGVATWRTFGWRGKRVDVTGYYHLGARDYEAGSGRFLSADPYGHSASMSLYDYAGGDPINFIDPRGRSASSFDPSGVTRSLAIKSGLDNIGRTILTNAYADLKQKAQFAAALGYLISTEDLDDLTFGHLSSPASDEDVDAFQMTYQFAHGSGPSSRKFTENSLMGKQLMRTDYLSSAIDKAVIKAQSGDFAPTTFIRQLANQGKMSYATGFVVDLLANPTRAFHGSIVGTVNVEDITDESTPQSYMTLSITITSHDSMSATSATHAPPGRNPDGTIRYGAALTPDNPYGENGPMRTINVDYNMTIQKTVPASSSTDFPIEAGYFP